MNQPPYHLRPNKAVDRLVFIDAIGRLRQLGGVSNYSYYSLGGPFLEDCRLVYEFFPEMKMVSIERDEEIYKRQEFHLPCGNLSLRKEELSSFINTYQADESMAIFWLDNTGLKYSHFDEFMTLLQEVPAGSMIKVTLDASARKVDGKTKIADFRTKYALVLPEPDVSPPVDNVGFASLLQKMLRVAAERALPADSAMLFQPVNSFYYMDSAAMLTVTGVVCFRSEVTRVAGAFADWQFANLDWSEPKKIDLPILTTKERLHLQRHLPCGSDAGATLRAALGYLTDSDNQVRTEEQLAQYADYHRYSPYFIRGVP